ncbi:MAG: D-2-hydroxyacid dehydrogenase [Cyclobacteriaceae bacterium]
MKIVVLDTDTIGTEEELKGLHAHGDVTFYATTSSAEVVDRIKAVHIIVTNKVVLDREVLDQAANLRLVCITATGTNNVDLVSAEEKNIAVKNVAGYSTNSVAQHTFSMLFHLISQLSYYHEFVASGGYSKKPLFTHFKGNFYELKGKTFGIIGLGAIGKRVAELAQLFGSRVVYYSTSGKNNDATYQRVELDELLKESDVVSIHAPLTKETKGLLNKENLHLMKSSAILLNNGRGGIVDEQDLVTALNEKQLAAAGLDVFEVEPLAGDSPLLSIQDRYRLLLTPHIAWASREAREELIDRTVGNIASFLKKA